MNYKKFHLRLFISILRYKKVLTYDKYCLEMSGKLLNGESEWQRHDNTQLRPPLPRTVGKNNFGAENTKNSVIEEEIHNHKSHLTVWNTHYLVLYCIIV